MFVCFWYTIRRRPYGGRYLYTRLNKFPKTVFDRGSCVITTMDRVSKTYKHNALWMWRHIWYSDSIFFFRSQKPPMTSGSSPPTPPTLLAAWSTWSAASGGASVVNCGTTRTRSLRAVTSDSDQALPYSGGESLSQYFSRYWFKAYGVTQRRCLCLTVNVFKPTMNVITWRIWVLSAVLPVLKEVCYYINSNSRSLLPVITCRQ